MRFLADENFPGPAVRALRSLGHDLVWARETMPSAADRDVLLAARRDGRVLLTCDKDFGELALGTGLAAPCGVILFRLGAANPAADNERIRRRPATGSASPAPQVHAAAGTFRARRRRPTSTMVPGASPRRSASCPLTDTRQLHAERPDRELRHSSPWRATTPGRTPAGHPDPHGHAGPTTTSHAVARTSYPPDESELSA